MSRKALILLPFLALVVWWLNCLPDPLFSAPLSTQVLDSRGEILSAKIANDGQWRLPAADSLSEKLGTCVRAFEDRRFYQHPGVDLAAIARAVSENYRAGRVVSGGSTITMQVARMARGNRARTLVQKLLEAAVALRLELKYSKDEILGFWLANAPFGGNVVGVSTACQRYFGRAPTNLSWGEAATLAVLPNSPALIHPGRSRAALLEKRNRLLDDLFRLKEISASERDLARLEPLPRAPLAMPRHAPHLLERLRAQNGDRGYQTTIDGELQQAVNRLVRNHAANLATSRIHNAAVMVSEVATGHTVAYVGNVPDLAQDYAPDVDIITSPRSPGSLLKPILYSLALEEGSLLPTELLKDVPTAFAGFRPANFHQDHDGAVAADRALARSLNIPFVYLLQDYGVARFHAALQRFGFGQMGHGADHYGLSLILGGAEITMEEIHGWFLGLARQQRFYYARQGRYAPADFRGPQFLVDDNPEEVIEAVTSPSGAGAGYATLEALRELRRPDEQNNYRRFASHRPVAWKTGTSFGYRDAWAVGTTPAYTVSVWVGNADGEGRDGLVGVRAAAPLLFSVFRELETRSANAPEWFEQPFDDQREVATCQVSGKLAGADCPAETLWLPRNAERGELCAFHRRFRVTADGEYRTTLDCEKPGEKILEQTYFTLPSREAHYYRRAHPEYLPLPPWRPACSTEKDALATMQIVYPEGAGKLSRAKNWNGEAEALLFEAAHRMPGMTIFWHLNGSYVAKTADFHSITLDPPSGRHLLTLVDEQGNRLEYQFEVL